MYKKDPNDLSRVIDELNPENAWALTEGIPTRKFDGTAMAIIKGELYKRYDVKKGREVPYGAIPCQDPDPITGHWPHWVKCEETEPSDKFAFEAFNVMWCKSDGTYELCGPKVQGNPERFKEHRLIEHGSFVVDDLKDRSFEGLKVYFQDPANDIEGIVFHHPDGRMCKIRKKDFGIKR